MSFYIRTTIKHSEGTSRVRARTTKYSLEETFVFFQIIHDPTVKIKFLYAIDDTVARSV